MTLQGFQTRKLQGLHKYLQGFNAGTPPSRTLSALAISSTDKVFLCDSLNHKILVYQLDGTKLDEWGTYGTSSGQLNSPSQIAWYDNQLYITDAENRVQVFSESGTWDSTILTSGNCLHIYNGYFYSINRATTSCTFSKYDISGTLQSSFTKTNMLVWTYNYEYEYVRAFADVPVDGVIDEGVFETYNERLYTFEDDGTISNEIKLEDYSASEKPLFISLFSVDSGHIYQAYAPYLRKHTILGSFLDDNNTGVSSSVRNWAAIKKHTDGLIYLAANYSNPLTAPKVQIYDAATLNFDSEWTAT